MRLKSVAPFPLELPAIGRVLQPGEVFEVDDDLAAALLDQPANFAAVKPTTTKDKE